MSQTGFTVDGSMLEGGGQLLRASLSLAAILRRPLCVHSIRAKRSKPGLAAQHAAGARLVAKLAHSALQGGTVQSTEVSLIPAPAAATTPCQSSGSSSTVTVVSEDAGTAGAVTLMLQVSLPVALFGLTNGVVSLRLLGGTNVSHSPPIDHTVAVLLPLLARMGVQIPSATIDRRGFFPRGGGSVRMDVQAADGPLQPIDLTSQGHIVSIEAVICGNSNKNSNHDVVIAAAAALEVRLRTDLSQAFAEVATDRITIRNDCARTHSQSTSSGPAFADKRGHKRPHGSSSGGSGTCTIGVQLIAHTSAGCILSANDLNEAASSLTYAHTITAGTGTSNGLVMLPVTAQLKELADSGACIDEHTADQLVLYAALAAGESRLLIEPYNAVTSSLHLDTVLHIASQLLETPPERLFRLETLSAAAQTDASSDRIDSSRGCRMLTIYGVGFQPAI